jgi:PTS system cellobiose-specific IIB component
MITIRLFCSAGMSTSMLIGKMESVANERGIDINVEAFPEAEMAKHLENTTIVLLGPQVRFALNKAKKLCNPKGIPVEVIDPVNYGKMDGNKVLDQALNMINQ